MSDNITYEEQTKITRIIIKAAVMLLEYGAESRLIEQSAMRLGKSLGVSSVEISLIPSAIVLTTLYKGRSVTTTRRAHHHPINMQIVHQVIKATILSEQNPHNFTLIRDELNSIKPKYYNKWLMIFMIGLGCSAFSYLHGVDMIGFFITFFAASIAMYVRVELAKRDYSLIVVYAITAFVATLIASISYYDNLSSTKNVVLTSSILLLVPGFVYVNSILDTFKGYQSMGWGRWMQATILTLMTSLGIIIAMWLLGIEGW